MGKRNFGNWRLALLLSVFIFSFASLLGQEEGSPSNLAEAFKGNSLTKVSPSDTEIEPVVVGRSSWKDKPAGKLIENKDGQKLSNSTQIGELDALETKQSNLSTEGLPVLPPKIMPAVDLHRNFEGTLVLQTRKLGFAQKFSYRLENANGKRLAFVDAQNLRVFNPVAFNGKKVNILGKLEPVEVGSKDLVIRAKIIRLIE